MIYCIALAGRLFLTFISHLLTKSRKEGESHTLIAFMFSILFKVMRMVVETTLAWNWMGRALFFFYKNGEEAVQ